MTTQTPSDPTTLHAATRLHAYLIWEKEGRPPGRDSEFWVRAEEELLADLPAATLPPNGAHPAAPAEAQPALPPLKPNGSVATPVSPQGFHPHPKRESQAPLQGA